MVDVAISRTALAVNTRSIDLVGGGTALTTGQTFSLDADNRTEDLLVVMEETGGSTASVVFDAGDEPPSMRAGLGSLTIALAANDVRYIILEGGRFIQDDGSITGTFTGTGKMYCARIPRDA